MPGPLPQLARRRPFSRAARALLAALAAALVLAVGAWGYTFGGWFTKKRTIEEHIAFIRPMAGLKLPADVSGPVGAVVLMPGCAGTRTNSRAWEAFFRAEGWATVIVDSFVPRGIDTAQELEAVCEAGRPWGFERGGDLVAAVVALRRDARIDPDRIVLFGESHGAWAVMDALTFSATSQSQNLDPMPLGWRAAIKGAVLLYPYCGWGSRSASRGWSIRAPAVLFVPEKDEDIEPQGCIDTARALQNEGEDLRLFALPDATHWFDNPADQDALPHRYDAAATALARREARRILASAIPPARNRKTQR